jgi:hypothetical protein
VQRADGLTKEETNALFADSKRDVGKLREHVRAIRTSRSHFVVRAVDWTHFHQCR